MITVILQEILLQILLVSRIYYSKQILNKTDTSSVFKKANYIYKISIKLLSNIRITLSRQYKSNISTRKCNEILHLKELNDKRKAYLPLYEGRVRRLPPMSKFVCKLCYLHPLPRPYRYTCCSPSFQK